MPPHFHLTEVALVSKKFVDCGGTMRDENVISFQLWSADDYDHRLAPCRAYGIVERAQEALGFGNLDIEVEYQGDTIGRYGLDFDNGRFLLTANKLTVSPRTSAASLKPNQSALRSQSLLGPVARQIQAVVNYINSSKPLRVGCTWSIAAINASSSPTRTTFDFARLTAT